ncbi:alpha/beta hydrolase [Nocardia sp. NPDC046763]|uniref:alpha/beta hydrolase n=1 Tax=Nocardia sp. NPDC046763 TaxID=3155256 RepID=UPI0033CD9082
MPLRSILTATLMLGAAVSAVPAAADPPDASAPTVSTVESSYPTTHGPQAMTVYYPGDPAAVHDAPAVVMVHGGAWVVGSRSLLDAVARQTAAAGFVVVNIEYDMSATPRYPREIADVQAAIDYVHADAPHLGVDPDRIGGLGTSAGANLIMLAATTRPDSLRAVVGWSGPYDLTTDAPGNSGVLPAVLYPSCAPGTAPCTAMAADASPITHVAAGDPPALLFNSDHELVALSQLTRFADRLRAAGDQVQTQILPGTRHASQYAADATEPSIAFLRSQL